MPSKMTERRRRIWLNYPYCMWCGRPLGFREATLEHIVPQSCGGTSKVFNLGIACQWCNNWRGASCTQAEIEHACFIYGRLHIRDHKKIRGKRKFRRKVNGHRVGVGVIQIART